MELKNKLEPIIAHGILGALASYLLVNYDKWKPSANFPSSWRSGGLEALLTYVHEADFGRFLGKSILIFTICYCVLRIYKTLKS